MKNIHYICSVKPIKLKVMKYYVYVTNCSNHNHMYEHDNLQSAIKQCEFASEHNTCILIKGTEIDWKKKVKK